MPDMNEWTPDGADGNAAAAPDIGGVTGVLSAREAAAALGISERTVRRAILRGDLIATKHAGSYQITPAALDAYRRYPSFDSTGQHVRRGVTAAAAPDSATGQRAAAPSINAAAPDTGQVVSAIEV